MLVGILYDLPHAWILVSEYLKAITACKARTYDDTRNEAGVLAQGLLDIWASMKTSIICTAFCAAMLAFSHDAHALALTVGDSHELGSVMNGWSSGDSDKLTYVNHLIGMALGTSEQAGGQKYVRSNNAFASLTQAGLAGHVNGNWYNDKSWLGRLIFISVCHVQHPK